MSKLHKPEKTRKKKKSHKSDKPDCPLVLVVDDERSSRLYLSEALKIFGFDVIAAENGLEALKVLQQNFFHLVISDVYMPQMNGILLLNRIKHLYPELPVILITGYSHYRQLMENSEYPPEGFLQKPISPEGLVRAIVKVVKIPARPDL